MSQAKKENNSYLINLAYYDTEIKLKQFVSKSHIWKDM